MKKAKFHYEAAAMAGHEFARYDLGIMEGKSGNVGRGFEHLKIAASAGHYRAMHHLIELMAVSFQLGVNRESVDSTLAAYNNSCAEMRSEARDTVSI